MTYRGRFFELKTKKERKRRYKNPIFIYDGSGDTNSPDFLSKLGQIVRVHTHSIEDFEFNSLRIIKYFKKFYGSMGSRIYATSQYIHFTVHDDQKEPFALTLMAFFMNYTMLILPVMAGADLSNWVPWTPAQWSNSGWIKQTDEHIKMCRALGNNRLIGEALEWSKYLPNLWVSEVGDYLGLSISNNEFVEVAMRSEEAMESITCSFHIPAYAGPSELEQIARERTADLLRLIGEQTDLSISTYARNGLFNAKQFKEFAVHITNKPDLYGNTIPFTHNTNIIMGLADPRAATIDAYGGRKAEDVKQNVSDAGALERALCILMTNLAHVDPDEENICDSTHFRTVRIEAMYQLDKLEGRVCTLTPDEPDAEYQVITPASNHLIGETIYVKTPITCTHHKRSEGYICAACYGLNMAQLNADVHIGKLAALNLSDDMEQNLLSAKHALDTNTNEVVFDANFHKYFIANSCQIYFSDEIIALSEDDDQSELESLFLEFDLSAMKKRQDGENRHMDRSIEEIVIYNEKTDEYISMREKNGTPFYLSQEFNSDYFLPSITMVGAKDIVRIPLSDLVDNGKVLCDTIFEYQYKNIDIAAALMELERILSKKGEMGSFESYDECLDKLIPLFAKGGVDIPNIQPELLISQMIFTVDGNQVDWTAESPEYEFRTISKSIQSSKAALPSIIYQESSRQLAGAYDTYEKDGTSVYDWFIFDDA